MDQKNKIPTKINSKYLLNEWNPQIKSILTKITKTSFMTFNSCCFNFCALPGYGTPGKPHPRLFPRWLTNLAFFPPISWYTHSKPIQLPPPTSCTCKEQVTNALLAKFVSCWRRGSNNNKTNHIHIGNNNIGFLQSSDVGVGRGLCLHNTSNNKIKN